MATSGPDRSDRTLSLDFRSRGSFLLVGAPPRHLRSRFDSSKSAPRKTSIARSKWQETNGPMLVNGRRPLTFSYQQRIAGFAVANQLPSLHGVKEFALAGGLMSYETNVADVYRRAASYVDQILKGASPTTARHIFSSSILQENAPWRKSADRLQFFSPTWWACLGAPPPAPLWRSAFLLSTIAQPTPTL